MLQADVLVWHRLIFGKALRFEVDALSNGNFPTVRLPPSVHDTTTCSSDRVRENQLHQPNQPKF